MKRGNAAVASAETLWQKQPASGRTTCQAKPVYIAQQQPSPWALGGGFGGGGTGELGDAGVGQVFKPAAVTLVSWAMHRLWLTGGGFGGQWSEHEGGSGQKAKARARTHAKPDKQGSPAIKEAVGNAASGKDAKGGKPDQAILTPQQIEQQFKEGKGRDFERAKALGMNAGSTSRVRPRIHGAALPDSIRSSKTGRPSRSSARWQPGLELPAAQQNSLSAWGCNPKVDPSNVVDHNKDTGLFAIRFEPSAQGAKNGTAPVVAFRGTEPDRGPRDAQADLGDKYIGQSECRARQSRDCQTVWPQAGEKADVVGYSLGGALAQRSLVDNAQNVRSLSTFQSPGIAQPRRRRRQRRRKEVRHRRQSPLLYQRHRSPRAGEAKVDGNYHEYPAATGQPG